ncbi:unnamed protein product [Mytilus coruscus]|uniref:LRAT domain-containing protein n=1 Tax=Mytilus coruscus TaxID=42192 RepID=A0A6J8C236_MYTCO|nr:unnamed protein product [Mytilus coruscus]
MEISFKRLMGYKHHGVVTSIWLDNDSFEMINLTGDSSSFFSSGARKAIPIKETCEFSDITTAYFYDYGEYSIDKRIPVPEDDETSATLSIVALRADILYAIYRKITRIRYDVRSFNCEHFASYCVTGVAFCNQTSAVLEWHINTDATEILDKE